MRYRTIFFVAVLELAWGGGEFRGIAPWPRLGCENDWIPRGSVIVLHSINQSTNQASNRPIN